MDTLFIVKSGAGVKAPVPILLDDVTLSLTDNPRIVGDLAAQVPVVLEIQREHSEKQLTGRSSDKDLLDKDDRKDETAVERLTSAQDDQIFSGALYSKAIVVDFSNEIGIVCGLVSCIFLLVFVTNYI